MLFTFAGSSHSKYASYLLETITTLELESSQQLRKSLLRTMILNLSGEPGGFAPCDIVQEYFNRLLEMIVERKGKDFDDVFIREVIARNLHRMAKLKPDLREGVNLAKHSSTHSDPHNNPESRILLQQYFHHQLHSRRVTRYVEEKDADDFTHGWRKLGKPKGKVAKFASETARARVKVDIDTRIAAMHSDGHDLDSPMCISVDGSVIGDRCERDSDSESDSDSDDDEGNSNFRNSMGVMAVVDGHLVMQTLDIDQTTDEVIASLESEYAESMKEMNDFEDEISDDGSEDR